MPNQPQTDHQIPIKVVQREIMPMMLHEHVGEGTEGDKKINVDRNMNGSLLMISVDNRNYCVDVGDIVAGIIAYEKANAA